MTRSIWFGAEKNRMDEDKTFYKIGTLSQKSGVSPTLLRAWEKRYALWTPERGPGRQRLYSQEDFLLICHLAGAIVGGQRIGELAALGREELLQQARKKKETEGGAVNGGEAEAGGQGLESYIRPLLSAAEGVDLQRLRATLQQAMLELSPDIVVHKVLLPTMAKVGEWHLAGRISIAGEHLISGMVEHYLRNCLEQARLAIEEKKKAPVLCSCFPGEEHRLGLLAVSYALMRQECPVVFLGAALPLLALEQAIIQLRPTSVWLSVTDPFIYRKNRSELAALVSRSAILFVVGGQGVREEDPLLLEAGCALMSPTVQLPAAIQRLLSREVK